VDASDRSLRHARWSEVMSTPTEPQPTCLQWFLPIAVAGKATSPTAPAATPLGTWVPLDMRLRDKRAYDQSFARIVAGEAATSDTTVKSRLRIFFLVPDDAWSEHVHKYDDGFRRIFTVRRTSLTPAPEIVRIGLFVFDSGDVSSHYLALTFRFPLDHPGADKSSWTLGDIVDLNYQLVGSEIRGKATDGDEHLLGTVQPSSDWTAEYGSGATGVDPLPWSEMLNGLLASFGVGHDIEVGPFAFDHGARSVSLTAAVTPGLDRRSAVEVAEHLGASMISTTLPNHPLGVHADGDVPSSLFERSHGICYYATQRSGGVVVYPDKDESDGYLLRTLPKEAQTQLPLLYLLALHQRRALSRIIDSLSAVSVIEDRHEREDDRNPAGEIALTVEQRLEVTREELLQIQMIQRSYYQLQAWTRYRQVSPRFGAQGFYDLAYRQHRIDETYSDVDGILTGLAEYLGASFTELEQVITHASNESERQFESRVQRYGLVFATVAVVLGFLGVNIDGVTSQAEGLGLPVLAALTAMVAFAALGLAGRWQRRNARRPPTRSD
jgi:hypothetical protein